MDSQIDLSFRRRCNVCEETKKKNRKNRKSNLFMSKSTCNISGPWNWMRKWKNEKYELFGQLRNVHFEIIFHRHRFQHQLHSGVMSKLDATKIWVNSFHLNAKCDEFTFPFWLHSTQRKWKFPQYHMHPNVAFIFSNCKHELLQICAQRKLIYCTICTYSYSTDFCIDFCSLHLTSGQLCIGFKAITTKKKLDGNDENDNDDDDGSSSK